MPSYRSILQSALARRLAVNSRYSLRAFARDLGVSPAFISQVLNGKRGLTVQSASEIFSKIGLSRDEQELYLLEVRKEQLRSTSKKAQIQKKIDSVIQNAKAYTVDPEQFQKLSNWYGLAILQLLRTRESPRKSVEKWSDWAAKKLELAPAVIEEALRSMITMGLVAQDSSGLRAIHDTVWTTNEVPSAAIRTFHKQMIEKAQTAIEMQEIHERFLQSVQLPIVKADLPEFQKDILKFRNQMMRKYGRTEKDDADTVYGLTLQLFKLLQD